MHYPYSLSFLFRFFFSVLFAFVASCSPQEDTVAPDLPQVITENGTVVTSVDQSDPFLSELSNGATRARRKAGLLKKHEKRVAWDGAVKMSYQDGSSAYAVPLDDPQSGYRLKNLVLVEKDGELAQEYYLELRPSVESLLEGTFAQDQTVTAQDYFASFSGEFVIYDEERELISILIEDGKTVGQGGSTNGRTTSGPTPPMCYRALLSLRTPFRSIHSFCQLLNCTAFLAPGGVTSVRGRCRLPGLLTWPGRIKT